MLKNDVFFNSHVKNREFLIIRNGPCCHICSKNFISEGQQTLVDSSSFKVYFNEFIDSGSSRESKNTQVMCRGCYKHLNLFMNLFSLERHINHEFLLSAYIFIFAKNPNISVKIKYSHISKFIRLEELVSDFWDYVSSCKKETQS
ncbi:MAG TPA: hypothetical protein DCL21_04785, partial [Alphaproteobacteria bacterium]|nr:hypothetical protein [Alphaproteobacteria bacterium]